ncbi:MAG: recombinase family protein [Planctomycetales bacterium]|nr:recombinase family protein [Planctomycetales bacterium]
MIAKHVDQKAWRCGLYLRVSSDRQASKEFSSLETQEDVLQALVREKNEKRAPDDPEWKIVKTYSEAKSAKDTHRPRFQEMLRDVEAGEVNMIVFLRLDRFSRSLRDFLNLQDFLKEHGCGFASRHDPMLDTSSPHGEFITRLLLMLAEYERKLTGARIKEKCAWRAAQGLWSGRQVLGYDLTRNPTGRIVPNPAEAEVVRFLFQKYAETRSLRLTAKAANERGYRTKAYVSRTGHRRGHREFEKNAVWWVLTNPVYVGKIALRDEVFEGKHEPVLPKDLWDEVQQILKSEAQHPAVGQRPRKRPFLLEGLVWCGRCGSALIPSYSRSRTGDWHYYYRCRSKYTGGPECKAPAVQADQIEGLVEAEVRKLARTPELLEEALEYARSQASTVGKDLRVRIQARRIELAKIEAEEKNLVNFIRAGGIAAEEKAPAALIEDLRGLRERIEATREEADALEAKLRSDGASPVDPEAIGDGLAFMDAVLDLLSPEEKARLLRTFVQRVTYTPERVQLFLFNEPLDTLTRREVRRLLAEEPGDGAGLLAAKGTAGPLVAVPDGPGSLGRPAWWAIQGSNL